jgi:hypothetical protein
MAHILRPLDAFITHWNQILMKQPHLEYLARRMREVHRHQPWTLSEGGLYIPHAYWVLPPTEN